jgi:transposase InsO family protein
VSLAFGQKARENCVARSVGQVGSACDNSVVETFFAALKKEPIYRRSWPERQETKTEVFDCVESFYKRRRRHSRLGWLSPAEFEGEASLPQREPQAIASP